MRMLSELWLLRWKVREHVMEERGLCDWFDCGASLFFEMDRMSVDWF